METNQFTAKHLLNQLSEQSLLDDNELQRLLRELPSDQVQATIHPLIAIAKLKPTQRDSGAILSLTVLCQWLANFCQIDYLPIDPLTIDVDSVTQVLSQQYAEKNGLLPIFVGSDSITIAVKNPFALSWQSELSGLLQKQIQVVFANPVEIDRYLAQFYLVANSTNLSQQDSYGVEPPLDQQTQTDDQHITQLVDWMLQYAIEQRASDIHLEPRQHRGEIRFRIDGILHLAHHVPSEVMLAIIGRLKTMGRMDIAEKRRPLDGRLNLPVGDNKEIELRLSTVPTAMGEKMVLRIFDPQILRRNFSELGLTNRELDLWIRLTVNPNGIILVTGPTGSGKTTTLYSTLRKLASREVNVCTIEDPVEMVEPRFNQIQVHAEIDLTFAAGVRSLLRQDPDIIMIGEIRDLETAQIAIQAALTGHLVLATLHTNDATSAITRLLELGVPAYLINATLLGVMAQRLLRTLCPHCKRPDEIDADTWHTFTQSGRIKARNTQKAPGCSECRQTGYLGRIGVYEMLELNNELKQQINDNADLQLIRDHAFQSGMLSLRHNGINKVAEGITTMEEVTRVTPSFSQRAD